MYEILRWFAIFCGFLYRVYYNDCCGSMDELKLEKKSFEKVVCDQLLLKLPWSVQ